jgi:hypothetical protein
MKISGSKEKVLAGNGGGIISVEELGLHPTEGYTLREGAQNTP